MGERSAPCRILRRSIPIHVGLDADLERMAQLVHATADGLDVSTRHHLANCAGTHGRRIHERVTLQPPDHVRRHPHRPALFRLSGDAPIGRDRPVIQHRRRWSEHHGLRGLAASSCRTMLQQFGLVAIGQERGCQLQLRPEGASVTAFSDGELGQLIQQGPLLLDGPACSLRLRSGRLMVVRRFHCEGAHIVAMLRDASVANDRGWQMEGFAGWCGHQGQDGCCDEFDALHAEITLSEY
mmetsp:Transcript_9284/g.25136  ORF Transcript_9284/g.25136 Transcript_9284/m.25136 type:complete len:239 (+) Transcript_9284:601-1317(+)